MATPIKAVPILSGEPADEFVRHAEENEQKPHHGLSKEREDRVSKVMQQLRDFRFPWDNDSE